MRRLLPGLLLALSAFCAADKLAAQKEKAMTTQATRLARAHSLVAAFNGHDVAASVQHLAAAVTWGRGDGSSVQGREAVAAGLRDVLIAFPDASLTQVQVLALEPDAVLVEWVLEATHRGPWRIPGRQEPMAPTGHTVRVVGADLLGFNASDEIIWDEARVDASSLFGQIRAPGALAVPPRIRDLATRYTAAWGSQDPASVAAFYSLNGSLTVNGGAPAVGRGAVTESARGFMTAFPDLQVLMDGLLVHGDRAVYRWTLVGTNTGPGGTGKRVHISGYEVWRIGADGLIAESRGYFDSAAYEWQIEHGVEKKS